MGSGKPKKTICAALSREEHERLSRMAGETGRTAAGCLRWLLHRHFMELDRKEPAIQE